MMELISHPAFNMHVTGNHPENGSRLTCLGDLPATELPYDESILHIIHQEDYIEHVRAYCAEGRALDSDTMTSPGSFKAAVYAANATVLASETHGFAVVRPPGHHAYPDHASGFCLFNNVAIAAQRLVEQGKHVLLLDFDGHLGDGTCAIFDQSNRVLYWSLHQFPAFPGYGRATEIGKGSGEGFTFNVPLPPGSGDDIFMDAFHTLLPVAKQFDPDVVAVSAGFDAHQFDPLLDLRLTMDSYYEIGKILSETFKNIFATLEGGYNTRDLPGCLYNFLDGINGNPMRFHEEHTDSDFKVHQQYDIDKQILLSKLKPYWTI